ncbi:MAG TPA: VanZ family protein [Methylobacter sp.]|jgi:VanZ family protein
MLFKWLWLCFLIILGFLSLNPWLRPDSTQAIGFISWDLLDHAAAYSLLSVLMMLAFRQQGSPWVVASFVIPVASLIGVLFEYCQYWFTVSRQFSFFDAAANVCGAVLGVIVFWSVQIYRKRYRASH